MEKRDLVLGVFGGGVVGGGVQQLVEKCMGNGRFGQLGFNMKISKICVRNLQKKRDYEVNLATTTFVTDFNSILGDPEINVVVEVMGGITDARDVVYSAIRANKHVVTANKALVAAYLPEIKALLKLHPQVQFAYEAAVCGAIPVIHSLQTDFVSDSITSVVAIANGTTNFMLCKMEQEGASYSDVLREAQDLGFAEADPTADVEGLDVQAKISIMAKLAYGAEVASAAVPTQGISALATEDFAYAKSRLNSTIKLLGIANYSGSGSGSGSICVYVSPHFVPLSHPLASAKGPGNMVIITSENMGGDSPTVLAGPGAGRFPTANSIINDLVRIAQGTCPAPFPLDIPLATDNNFHAQFYVRVPLHAPADADADADPDYHIYAECPLVREQVLNCANDATHASSGITSQDVAIIVDSGILGPGSMYLHTRHMSLKELHAMINRLCDSRLCAGKPVWIPILPLP